jgi:hypothetical protein
MATSSSITTGFNQVPLPNSNPSESTVALAPRPVSISSSPRSASNNPLLSNLPQRESGFAQATPREAPVPQIGLSSLVARNYSSSKPESSTDLEPRTSPQVYSGQPSWAPLPSGQAQGSNARFMTTPNEPSTIFPDTSHNIANELDPGYGSDLRMQIETGQEDLKRSSTYDTTDQLAFGTGAETNADGTVPQEAIQEAEDLTAETVNPDVIQEAEDLTAETVNPDVIQEAEDLKAETVKHAEVMVEWFKANGSDSRLNKDMIFDRSKDGKTPEIKEAMKFFNDHPGIRNQIDIQGSGGNFGSPEGVWNARDFENVPNIDFDAEVAAIVAAKQAQNTEEASKVTTLKEAAAELEKYLKSDKFSDRDRKLDTQKLLDFASNRGGEVPEKVQQSAQLIRDDLELFLKLDVNADNKLTATELANINTKYLDKDGKDLTAETVKHAAVMAEWFKANGHDSRLNKDMIFDRSKDGKTPEIKEAMKFFNDHPEIRNQIDVRGSDLNFNSPEGVWNRQDFQNVIM